MTGTFAGYLIYTKVIDGFGGLGRLTKDYGGLPHRTLTFTDYLKQQFPDQWIAYQAYLRLINKDT